MFCSYSSFIPNSPHLPLVIVMWLHNVLKLTYLDISIFLTIQTNLMLTRCWSKHKHTRIHQHTHRQRVRTGVDSWEGHRGIAFALAPLQNLYAFLAKRVMTGLKASVDDFLTFQHPGSCGAHVVWWNSYWKKNIYKCLISVQGLLNQNHKSLKMFSVKHHSSDLHCANSAWTLGPAAVKMALETPADISSINKIKMKLLWFC